VTATLLNAKMAHKALAIGLALGSAVAVVSEMAFATRDREEDKPSNNKEENPKEEQEDDSPTAVTADDSSAAGAVPPLPLADDDGRRPIIVHLGSKSEAKAQAVRNAVARVHGRPVSSVNIQLHAVPSNVGEQPCGVAETFQGCLNRLENTKLTLSEGEVVDYVFAIENGIEECPVPRGRRVLDESEPTEAAGPAIDDNNATPAPASELASVWFDRAAVLVENRHGDRSSAWSAAVRTPKVSNADGGTRVSVSSGRVLSLSLIRFSLFHPSSVPCCTGPC
jgi:non-canonical (house-cleaning) NTP pyrophosphatase